MKVLSTKMLPADLHALARQKGILLSCVDYIKTNPVAFSANSTDFDALVFTSANAVNYFFDNAGAKGLLDGKPVFSLSGQTADALRLFDIIPVIGAETAEELAGVILQNKQLSSILHPCSNLRLNALQKKLGAEGIAYTPLVVYETVAIAREPLTEKFEAIMFFSPSGIESFCMANTLDSQTLYCCIGETTLAALRAKKTDLQVITGAKRDAISMIEMIEIYFKTHA